LAQPFALNSVNAKLKLNKINLNFIGIKFYKERLKTKFRTARVKQLRKPELANPFEWQTCFYFLIQSLILGMPNFSE